MDEPVWFRLKLSGDGPFAGIDGTKMRDVNFFYRTIFRNL